MEGYRKRISGALQAIAAIGVSVGLGSDVEYIQTLIMENTGKIGGLFVGLWLFVDHYCGTAKKREDELSSDMESSYNALNEYAEENEQLQHEKEVQVEVNLALAKENEKQKEVIQNLQMDEVSFLDDELSKLGD